MLTSGIASFRNLCRPANITVVAEVDRIPIVFSGHGVLPVENSSPIMIIPPRSSMTFWTPHGSGMSTELGNAIESGAPISIEQFKEIVGARTYLPGSVIPDYTLMPIDLSTVVGNPVTVDVPTSLSSLLKPEMGNVQWAACRRVVKPSQ
jgi:hypothetical protein